MTNSKVDCPVDLILINERKARLTAGCVFILAVVYLLTSAWIIPVFLVADFFVRGFNLGRYSLLSLISDKLIPVFAIKPKLVDQAPKRFAARIGLLFSITMLVQHALQFKTGASVIAIILAVFALLESSIGFCAGCHVYSFYSKFVKNKTAFYTICLLVTGIVSLCL